MGLGMLALCRVDPAAAASSSLTASADQALRFGTLVTAGGGARTVAPDGTTTNAGVFPLGDRASGPAQYTITFARATGDKFIYTLMFQISLASVPNVKTSGLQGSLGSFTTDLPGVPTLIPGQFATYVMPNCVTAVCSITFHVGGTLSVVRTNGTAALSFPLPLVSVVTAVLG